MRAAEIRRSLVSTSAILVMRVRLDDRAASRNTAYQEGRLRPQFLWSRACHGAYESHRTSLSGPGGLNQKWRKSSLGGRPLTGQRSKSHGRRWPEIRRHRKVRSILRRPREPRGAGGHSVVSASTHSARNDLTTKITAYQRARLRCRR